MACPRRDCVYFVFALCLGMCFILFYQWVQKQTGILMVAWMPWNGGKQNGSEGDSTPAVLLFIGFLTVRLSRPCAARAALPRHVRIRTCITFRISFADAPPRLLACRLLGTPQPALSASVRYWGRPRLPCTFPSLATSVRFSQSLVSFSADAYIATAWCGRGKVTFAFASIHFVVVG